MKKLIFFLLIFMFILVFIVIVIFIALPASMPSPSSEMPSFESPFFEMSSSETPSFETSILAEADAEKAFENVLPAAVRIQGDGYYGSGCIFEMTEEEIIIVTNRHVAQYFQKDSYVTFFNGAEGKGSVVFQSETADIGFIGVSASELLPGERSGLRCVNKEKGVYEKLSANDYFFMIDIASDSQNPVWSKGSVTDKGKFLEDYGTEMLYGDGIAVSGMSGSGMFDFYGNYIGTLSGATENYELAGVPSEVVFEAYKEYAITAYSH